MQILLGLCITLSVGTGPLTLPSPSGGRGQGEGATDTPKTPIGKTVASFKLQDYRGAWHSLEDFSKDKVVVIAFLGAECPLANRYASRLGELAREFGPKGVAFIGIDSNQQDGITQIAHLARTYQVEFPILKDVGNVVADRLGARRTPEVFVLDQYGIGYSRPKVTRRDLAAALGEMLAGKPVTQPVCPPEGCLIGRVQQKPGSGDVTYCKQIARIFQSRCVACHRPGSIGPFALTSYKEAAGWSAMIRE